MNPHELLTMLEQATEIVHDNLQYSKSVFTVTWRATENAIAIYEPSDDWVEARPGDLMLGQFSYETTRTSPYNTFRQLVQTACDHLSKSPENIDLYSGVVSLMYYEGTIKA